MQTDVGNLSSPSGQSKVVQLPSIFIPTHASTPAEFRVQAGNGFRKLSFVRHRLPIGQVDLVPDAVEETEADREAEPENSSEIPCGDVPAISINPDAWE
ncbi:hypothetical protein BF95_12185 [Sphingobium sp. Ant17]|nr:hypothetical protein BF95_12185 [Sphingobium sp. Ant17]